MAKEKTVFSLGSVTQAKPGLGCEHAEEGHIFAAENPTKPVTQAPFTFSGLRIH